MRRGLREFEDDEREYEKEITLGPVLLWVIGGVVLVLCALCFWLGLSMGRQTATPPSRAQASSPVSEPLPAQAQNSLSKPLAKGVVPTAPQEPAVPMQAQPFGGDQSPADHALTSYAPVGADSTQSAQPQVKPALPTSASASSGTQGSAAVAQSPPQSASSFMVQIAELSRAEDARVLMNALKQHGYNATVRRNLTDGMIHVQIGPFATRAEAEKMSQKLEGDGYNAEVRQ